SEQVNQVIASGAIAVTTSNKHLW
ncbi:TPA: glycerol-3-phosphate responsive antiterminator, partial [Listeria monocytogenes]|nr:glycerol-3-phosphate responsive antiterminator [Listeria monocytogenes]